MDSAEEAEQRRALSQQSMLLGRQQEEFEASRRAYSQVSLQLNRLVERMDRLQVSLPAVWGQQLLMARKEQFIVTGLSTLATINGPINLGPSLRAGSLKLMSLETTRPSDHTRKEGAWYGDGPPMPFSSRQSE